MSSKRSCQNCAKVATFHCNICANKDEWSPDESTIVLMHNRIHDLECNQELLLKRINELERALKGKQ